MQGAYAHGFIGQFAAIDWSKEEDRQPIIHNVKCHSQYFWAVRAGMKPFEIRYNDRDYRVGDFINLLEYVTEHRRPEQCEDGYTGESLMTQITYMTTFEQKPNYVVMGIRKLPTEQQAYGTDCRGGQCEL